MKNLAMIITAMFLLVGLSANAQMNQRGNQQSDQQQGMMMQGKGMMQGGMHRNMTGGMMCPMHQSMMVDQAMPMKKYMGIVNMLPNMKEKLSLSQDQAEQLIDMQTSFKKQQVDYKADLAKKSMNLKNMMMDDASSNDLEAQMQEVASTKIKMKVEAYETAKNMKSLLNDDQKESLKNMMEDMMMQQGGMQKGGMKKNMMNQ
ncbi:MAG: hypothetical protein R6U04_03565 [Bacteroidales bacterium]